MLYIVHCDSLRFWITSPRLQLQLSGSTKCSKGIYKVQLPALKKHVMKVVTVIEEGEEPSFLGPFISSVF